MSLSAGMQQWHCQAKGKGATAPKPEQKRRARCDDDVTGEVERERLKSYARAHIGDEHRRGQRGGAMTAQR